jgi:hypothetical protein
MEKNLRCGALRRRSWIVAAVSGLTALGAFAAGPAQALDGATAMREQKRAAAQNFATRAVGTRAYAWSGRSFTIPEHVMRRAIDIAIRNFEPAAREVRAALTDRPTSHKGVAGAEDLAHPTNPEDLMKFARTGLLAPPAIGAGLTPHEAIAIDMLVRASIPSARTDHYPTQLRLGEDSLTEQGLRALVRKRVRKIEAAYEKAHTAADVPTVQ